jgi:hypothetical protein
MLVQNVVVRLVQSFAQIWRIPEKSIGERLMEAGFDWSPRLAVICRVMVVKCVHTYRNTQLAKINGWLPNRMEKSTSKARSAAEYNPNSHISCFHQLGPHNTRRPAVGARLAGAQQPAHVVCAFHVDGVLKLA